MLKRRRTSRLPDPLVRRLAGGDRPLASTELVDGAWAVVTKPALVVVDEEGVRQRHPWHHIENGRWDGESRTFTITWSDRTRPRERLEVAGEHPLAHGAVVRRVGGHAGQRTEEERAVPQVGLEPTTDGL